VGTDVINDKSVAIVDGSAVPEPASEDLSPVTYTNVGNVVLSAEERAMLDRPTEIHHVAIRDTGEVYIPHACLRTRLRKAVGCGSFGQQVVASWQEGKGDDTILYVRLALFIRGSLMATAIGSHRYRKATEKRLDFSDSFEAAESNAFTRCCKKISLGVEPWIPSFRKTFKDEYCVRVTVKDQNGRYTSKWRLKTDEPFEGEIAPQSTTEQRRRNMYLTEAEQREVIRVFGLDQLSEAERTRILDEIEESEREREIAIREMWKEDPKKQCEAEEEW
jgi:hypothetical protein